MKFILFILLIAGGYYYYQTQLDTGSSKKINSANLPSSVKTLKERIDTRKITKDDVKKLGDAFYKAKNDEARQDTIKLLTYALLATNPGAFPKFKQKINRDYAEQGYLDFVSDEFTDTCNACSGEGSGKCTKCKGTTKCMNQKCTEGRIVYKGFNGQTVNNQCPVCRGKDQCSTCIGSGLSSMPCKSCKGSGFKNTQATAIAKYKDAIKSL